MDKQENRRLTEVRERLQKNISEFAPIVGIKQGTLSQVEAGEKSERGSVKYVPVSKKVKEVLYDKLGVNKIWFETGHGSMFRDGYPKDIAINSRDSEALRELQRIKAENESLKMERDFWKSRYMDNIA